MLLWVLTMLRPTREPIVCTATVAIIPGIQGSMPTPVCARFKSVFPILLSIFRATLVSATTNTNQISTPPDIICDMADIMSFRKTIFIIITNMEPCILHQPLKILLVLRLPPIAKASGAKKVNTLVIIVPFTSLNQQFEHLKHQHHAANNDQPPFCPTPNENTLLSCVVTVMERVSTSISITVPAIPEQISQICRDESNKNENTEVRMYIIFGFSTSKPTPDITDLIS